MGSEMCIRDRIRTLKAYHLGTKVDVGDVFIFSAAGAVSRLIEKDYSFDPNGWIAPDGFLSVSSLPLFDWWITGGSGQVARHPEEADNWGPVIVDGDKVFNDSGNYGSAVMLNSTERSRIDDSGLFEDSNKRIYFQQALFKPSVYTTRPTLTAKVRDLSLIHI